MFLDLNGLTASYGVHLHLVSKVFIPRFLTVAAAATLVKMLLVILLVKKETILHVGYS